MIDVQHLRKKFSTVTAVNTVSFSVKRGEIFGLIGPNGAGKTTTIRMIMNILKPDEGQVLINGTPSNEKTKNILGYLPEERGLYRKNKLINAIAYFGSLKGLSHKEARERALPMLERFQLSSYTNRKIEELSRGNQQKVQFIISMLHDPPVLVFDELFSGLDPINQELMKEMLLSLKRDNRAIIFSTHQMDHAEKLCDDLCLINKGKTILAGTPGAIKEHYGNNTVRVEFNGTLPEVNGFDGVRKSYLFGSTAELELEPRTETNTLLSQLMQHVEIRKFERVEPSLHSIFIGVVGSDDEHESTADAKPITKQTVLLSKDKRVRKSLLIFFFLILAAMISLVIVSQRARPQWHVPLLIGLGALGSLYKYFKVRKLVARELAHDSAGGVRNEK